MTRGNRILSTLVLLGLLTLSLSGMARSQSTPPKTFTISGATGVAQVTLRVSRGATVVTDEIGFYSAEVPQGWAGTITPVKLGYTFEPPSRTYASVAESLENEDYVGTLLMYQISGNAMVGDARIEGLPEEIVTDADGAYTATVPYGWSDVLTPNKDGFVFEPAQRMYQRVTKDFLKQDYVPRLRTYTISGHAGAPGVVLQGFPQEVVSDSQGKYQVRVDHGWSGTVAPRKKGFSFKPPESVYTSVGGSFDNQDYTAQEQMVTISNVITCDNEPLEGVTFTAEPGGYTGTTDSQGRYIIRVPYGWSGHLTYAGEEPDWSGHQGKSPLDFTNVISDIIEGPRVRGRSVTISNVIRAGNEPIQGVMIIARPGEYAAITDSRGRYRIQVPYGWSGYLEFSKPGFDFVVEVSYFNVTADVIDEKSTLAEGQWPPYPSEPSQGGAVPAADVLVIPTAKTAPEKIAETTEDLRVMLQIFREKLSEPRMILGMLRDYGSFFDSDRKVEAIYLQGTAAMFVIEVDFPYSFRAQQSGEGEVQGQAVDPIWERARQNVRSPGGARGQARSSPTEAMAFDQFRDELLRSLKHASNVRHIDPNESVILTIVVQDEDTNWPDRPGRGGGYSGAGRRGRGGLSPAAVQPLSSTTVLTMQAKKADIDAFAQGTLDFDQFRQKVRSFTY